MNEDRIHPRSPDGWDDGGGGMTDGMTASDVDRLMATIRPGVRFSTPFEDGCVALTAPDSLGCFDGLDSDGVRCSFSILVGAMPLRNVRAYAREEEA